ncbi:hypothetical protein ABFX02_12G030300 [Erythranthe guttata]
MNTKTNIPWFSFLHLILTIKFLIILQARNGLSGPEDMYQSCDKTFSCGENITEIGYPFRGISNPEHCGHPNFVLTCHDGKNNITNIEIMGVEYRVLEIAQTTQTMTIAREDVMEAACPTEMKNTTLDYSTFDFGDVYMNITFLYGCPPPDGGNFFPSPPSGNLIKYFMYYVPCGNNGEDVHIVPGNYDIGMCRDSVIVPTPVPPEGETQLQNITELDRIMRQGFLVRWKIGSQLMCDNCTASKGRCGYNLAKNQTACYCPVPPYVSNTCPISEIIGTNGTDTSSPTKIPILPLALGAGLGVIALTILAIIIVFCYFKRRRSLGNPKQVRDDDMEKFVLQHGSLALKRYKYSEIKKMTKSFNEKLGKGGYGSVYKGVLPDGTLVAVKVLIETDSNGEEFINEVASISRTSHVNIVNLLGFCYNRNKRALVYEFMPNKSLDKFINNNYLGFDKLYEIAVGVAKGLQYLHTGCNTRIVHFDIKPQNILLDEEFSPKISDFGLAKLCKKKQSIFSVTGTRGTIGYIAPEIFSRNFGGASHKSDVYSYGMMILEMAGARKFDEIVTTQSSENCFSDKMYEQVILDVTTKLDDLVVEDDDQVARKMFLIGFWCIQTSPSDRPSMSKVVEMLEGSLRSIQIPPKPLLFSPSISGNELSSSLSAYVGLEHSVDGPI